MEELLGRRSWIKLVSILALSSEARAQNPLPATSATTPAVPATPKVSKDQLAHALSLLGLEFTEEQQEMMLPGINQALSGYAGLRKMDIPLDTEPAIRFYPTPPKRGPATFAPNIVPARPFHDIEDLAFRPVTDLQPLLRARKVSSTDLTKMYLARLKQYSPKLNCVITLTEDLALTQAAEADAEIRRGHHRGPLHGIPWGAKDLFATAGIRTTWGAEPFQQQVFNYNATVVDRLHKAGAVLLAKLSMGALAQGGLWFGGMTKTPWNVEQTSSGSSAGSAAATSAGLVGFALGTETLGSIISPCTRCGVVGVRPTYGRVSRFGAMGLSWTMDKIGPICRSTEDCAIVLRAIHGPDGRDLTVIEAPLAWEPRLGLHGLRIGVVQAGFDNVAEPENKALYKQALADLQSAGATLVPATLPRLQTGPLHIILSAEAATAFDDITRSGAVNQLQGQSADDWPNSFRTARLIPAVEYLRAQRARTLLMRQMDRVLNDWDVLVTPTYGPLLTATNLTGHPQVVVPCGFTNGMPQSIVFTGKLYQEGTPLRVAHAYEQHTDWHNQHPPMNWT